MIQFSLKIQVLRFFFFREIVSKNCMKSTTVSSVCQPNSVSFSHLGETGDMKLILLDILQSAVHKIRLKL